MMPARAVRAAEAAGEPAASTAGTPTPPETPAASTAPGSIPTASHVSAETGHRLSAPPTLNTLDTQSLGRSANAAGGTVWSTGSTLARWSKSFLINWPAAL